MARGGCPVDPVPATRAGALRLFRRLFLEALATLTRQAGWRSLARSRACVPRGFAAYLAPLRKRNWFVYAKPPFAGPEAVLAYLARYTHRVAIANSRLISLDRRGVTFRYKDYRRDGRARVRHHDARPRRVHQALPASRPAQGVPPHPSLRAARQPAARPTSRAPGC